MLYAERIKLRTIQHRPVGGFEKFETLGDATIETATLGKNATSGTEIKLTENITNLSFGRHFNQKIELTENITNLSFGYGFNQNIELTVNITHLSFGYWFNQKIELTEMV